MYSCCDVCMLFYVCLSKHDGGMCETEVSTIPIIPHFTVFLMVDVHFHVCVVPHTSPHASSYRLHMCCAG